MKRIGLALVLVVLFAPQAFGSAMDHGNGAIGFHQIKAPLGIRWWMGSEQSMAIDIGLGFDSSEDAGERVMDFALDLGLPIGVKTWERVHFLFRPGLCLTSNAETVPDPDDPGETMTERFTDFTIAGELEAEVFVTDNFSVSASHGVHIAIEDGGEESSTSFGSFGNNMTDIGFHLYGIFD